MQGMYGAFTNTIGEQKGTTLHVDIQNNQTGRHAPPPRVWNGGPYPTKVNFDSARWSSTG